MRRSNGMGVPLSACRGVPLSACRGPKKNNIDQETEHVSPPGDSIPPRSSFLIAPTARIGDLDSKSRRGSLGEDFIFRLSLKRPPSGASQLPADTLQYACRRPCLSEEDQTLVLDSWQVIKEDVARVGTVTFLSMFTAEPETFDLFAKFSHIPKHSIKSSAVFIEHILLVMSCVDKTIARLQEHDKLEHLLHGLGDIHRHIGVTRSYFVKIIPSFIDAIRPATETWTEDLERAWVKFMRLMCHVICERLHP